MKARKRPLALAVFAAADVPGMQRAHLRGLCVELTGVLPTSGRYGE
jgi:hypothetical protein